MGRSSRRRLVRDAQHASLILGALLLAVLALVICAQPPDRAAGHTRPHPLPVASRSPEPITTTLPPTDSPTFSGGKG